MTSDETIRKAARVIGSVMSRWDMDGRPDVAGGIDTLIARALAQDGLLAPSPLREEWGVRWDNGLVWAGLHRYAGAGDEGTPVRRWVSEWKEA